MNSPAIAVSPGVVESPRAPEQLGSSVDTSFVTLPATPLAVDARGLALGVLAALAFIFESFSLTLLVAGVSLAIATIVGTFVTTWMIGRIAT